MLRDGLPCVAALLAVGCTGVSEPPTIAHLSPSTLAVDQTPALVTIEGQGLSSFAQFSLNDQRPANVTGLQVYLGDVALPIVRHPNTEHVEVQIAGFGPGRYDLSVVVGSGRTARRPFALTITAAGVNADAGAGSDAATAATTTLDPRTACSSTPFGAREPLVIEGLDGVPVLSPALSADNTTLYFETDSAGSPVIMRAQRSDRGSVFSAVELVPGLPTDTPYGTPFLSYDGLALYFWRENSGGVADRELYTASRGDTGAVFGSVRPLNELNTLNRDHFPWVSDDELWIVYISVGDDGVNHYLTAHRSDKRGVFDPPQPLVGFTASDNNGRLFLAQGGLEAYFSSSRAGTSGGDDLWFASRTTLDDGFVNLVNLSGVNTSGAENGLTLSYDGEELIFVIDEQAQSTFARALRACP